ncbi:MAG: hypothetical protein ACI85S_001425, partial [Pseudohongiellaceae bacterium]
FLLMQKVGRYISRNLLLNQALSALCGDRDVIVCNAR